MGLVTLKEILGQSIEKHYAVGAFDTMNHLMTESILSAAEAERAPVILMFIDAMFPLRSDYDSYFKCVHEMINHTTVPVALMLDHGGSFEGCMKAIHYGFSAVMFDGSMLPFEENVEQTREIVKAAHACGVSVEAEIGHVGGLEADQRADPEGTEVDVSGYSEPDMALRFAQATGVDALAIAFGTVHGKYRGVPKLDYARLAKIRSLVDVPLVMHGGSGVTPDGFRQAVAHGISKVNISTAMIQAATERMLQTAREKDRVNFLELYGVAQGAIQQTVQEHIRIFGTQPLRLDTKPVRFG